MRTTIRIDDELYRRVKARASRSDRTIGELIEDALRMAFQGDEPPSPLRDLPRYGGSGVLPGVDLASNAALRDIMDSGTSSDAMR